MTRHPNRTYAKLRTASKEIASKQVRVEDQIIEAFENKEITEADARELLGIALFTLDEINEHFE